MTEECKQKISQTLKAKGIRPPSRIGIKHTEDTKNRMRISRTGMRLSDEARLKLSIAKTINPTTYWLGKNNPHTTGKNHKNWKGGQMTLRERKVANEAKRRTMKRKSGGSFTLEEWTQLKEFYDFMCLCCKRQEPEIKLSADHIIPVSKGGSSYIENIQPLCMTCNLSKGVKVTSFKS